MTDPGFPSQHTTTTITSNTAVRTDIRYDPSYIRTIPGMIKIAQIALSLLGFICIEVSGGFSYTSRGSFYIFVAMVAFWFSGFLLLFYLFHIVEKFYRIPWLKMEMLFCAVWTLMYLITSCLAATFGVEAFVAAAFFGFCAMVAYGFDAYLKYGAVQRGELAQGDRIISKQTATTTTPPPY